MLLYATMATTQCNIRLPKEMLEDIEFITNATNTDKSDFIRMLLAKQIMKEKEEVISRINERFISCQISDKDYAKLMGLLPIHELHLCRKLYLDKKIEQLQKQKRKFETYSLPALNINDSDKKLHYDKHMKKVIKKLEGRIPYDEKE